MKKTLNYRIWVLMGLAAELFLLLSLRGLEWTTVLAVNFFLAGIIFFNYRFLMSFKIFNLNFDKELRRLVITENYIEKFAFGLLVGFALTLANGSLFTQFTFYKIWFHSTLVIYLLWFGVNYVRVLHVKTIAPHSMESRRRLYG